MGFWHTGQKIADGPTWVPPWSDPTPSFPKFVCPECGLGFSTERDQRAHRFDGHVTKRPAVVFKGRECGRTRLTVTAASAPADWRVSDVEHISINGRDTTVDEAAGFLASTRAGVQLVTVHSGPLVRSFEFDFCLAEEEDLGLVDHALDKLISNGELSLQAIDAFIMRAGRGETARRYREGLANYLYGVLHREGTSDDTEPPDATGTPLYEQRYNSAVSILGSFDRPPAEAICGLVAFHYNQFDLAVRKTNSHRVSDVAARFRSMIEGSPFVTASLIDRTHGSFDEALSDSVTEELLGACAMALDGSDLGALSQLLPWINGMRPADQYKVRLVAAEALLAAGDVEGARRHSEALRHSRDTDAWYAGFRTRMQEVGQ